MANHVSATTREETPHANRTTRTATIINALKRRAQSVLNDQTLDPQTRAIIRYSLRTNDPWLAELVRRADAGEDIIHAGELVIDGTDASIDTTDYSKTSASDGDDAIDDKIQTLTEILCRGGDEAGEKSAALVILMATIESAAHPKAIANAVKHLAFNHCSELNLYGMVDTQIAMLEAELLADNSAVC